MFIFYVSNCKLHNGKQIFLSTIFISKKISCKETFVGYFKFLSKYLLKLYLIFEKT